jgi:uncharacterized protein YbaR (Trm112 family)
MHTFLVEMLECPLCQSDLAWTVTEQSENRIEAAEASCTSCSTTYPVREGIGIFLLPELKIDDLWEQVDSGLIQSLRQQPDIERQLLDMPLDDLTPADQFFRALVLEARGMYAEAKAAEELADKRIYTSEYRVGRDNQFDYLLEHVSGVDGAIIDLASGRCQLAGKLARELSNPIVATDFSLTVLRRNRKWFEYSGLYDQVSLLAFDARNTPFKDKSINTLTTFLGLPNISEPGAILIELRRVVAGAFLAISHFYPEDDNFHATELAETGLDKFLFRKTALESFSDAGWDLEVANPDSQKALPTPKGVVVEGAVIDSFPMAETILDWCVLVAR